MSAAIYCCLRQLILISVNIYESDPQVFFITLTSYFQAAVLQNGRVYCTFSSGGDVSISSFVRVFFVVEFLKFTCCNIAQRYLNSLIAAHVLPESEAAVFVANSSILLYSFPV